MLQDVDLKVKLLKVRNKSIKEDNIIGWVESVFSDLDLKRASTLKTIKESSEIESQNIFDFDKLDMNMIFHISHIKQICVDYRLRFLDTKYFKSEYPEEVISKIHSIEKEHNITLTGYKIAAPSVLFKLKKADDPLLFVPMGNNYYYLIHKWGDDLHPLRKYKYWAVKNLSNFALSLLIISFLLTILTHTFFFRSYSSISYSVLLFLFYLKGAVGFGLFFGISSGKNFSDLAWQSKYDKLC